jgi:hypothetical protein
MGFRQIWRDIISGLLCSSTTQVLLNGTPGNKFFHRKGLRKGDPLSPILFILVMDVLGHMFSKVVADDMLQPQARRVLPQRISLYADDVVMFIRHKESDIALTMDILHLFGIASDFKTNLQKSNVLLIRCEEQDLHVVQQ